MPTAYCLEDSAGVALEQKRDGAPHPDYVDGLPSSIQDEHTLLHSRTHLVAE
jgi:hypothetical protein